MGFGQNEAYGLCRAKLKGSNCLLVILCTRTSLDLLYKLSVTAICYAEKYCVGQTLRICWINVSQYVLTGQAYIIHVGNML